jgi:Trk K+ transport system NAD-binding subunit
MQTPTFAEAFKFWLKLGFISFGNPARQIAVMQKELVENKKWIDNGDFLLGNTEIKKSDLLIVIGRGESVQKLSQLAR